MITREEVVKKLQAYLQRQLSLAELVDWAEDAMQEEEFEAEYHAEIRNVIARLGVADVRAFGLTWEECENLLAELGYHTSIEVVKAD